MKIVEKFAKKQRNPQAEPCPVIAFLGDSVTQGCFEVFIEEGPKIETVYEPEYAYHNYLKKILGMLYPSVPVHIINAGISGDRAEGGFERLERDVLRYHPDLTVVCFGLNDSASGAERADQHPEFMRKIFEKLQASGSEIIYMTPNMMAPEVFLRMENEILKSVAKNVANVQSSGGLKALLEQTKAIAASMGIPVCDVYQKWETLYKSGVDIISLLSNQINHPTREMNWLFAISLAETMFGENTDV